MVFRSKNILNSFSRWFNLLVSPEIEWSVIAKESKRVQSIFITFLFPITIVCSLITFAGFLIHNQSISNSIARFFVSFLSLNLGFYASGKMIKLLAPNFQLQVKMETIYPLIIYSGAIFCLFHSLAKLFTPNSFLEQFSLVFQLYFIRVLWLGISPMLPISKNKKSGFTIMASLLILILPLVFERMFSIIFKLPITI
jgi:hypothetical protein